MWQQALPGNGDQALYFYRNECWGPRRLRATDLGFDPENDEANLNYEFHHNLLECVQFELPAFFVNREARSIALIRAREQNRM